ncbi:hypothetical protein [Mycobacteroides franklinii]|uniref:hypothetical protein n=1 Tax=Mycobacteroides franklinii TaxID=948102 RepID=UPI000D6A11C8|nr:hypothetical protein [Mycobacteroides franklinii]
MAGVTGWWAETFSEPTQKVLVLAGAVPAVAVTHGVYVFPSAAALTLTGSEPPVIGPPLRPGSPTLTLTGGVPGTLIGNVLTPGGAGITVAGGTPTVVQSNNNLLFPAAAARSLTGGTPTIITGPILIPTAATPALTGGVPSLAQRYVPAGAAPTLTGGRPLINIVYPPPTVQMTLTGGRPLIAIVVTPTGGTPVLTGGTASLIQGVIPTTSLSLTAGTPRILQTIGPPGATPTLTGGAPLIATNIPASGATASLTGGTPIVTNVSAVAYISSAAAAATSVSIPAHSVGDLIVIFAFNPFTTTAPTAPSPGGTVPSWNYIDNANSGSGSGCTTAQFKATATNTTSGTWSNAVHVMAVVVRGQNASSPIGGHASQGGSSATTTAPSVTMTHTDGSSVLLHFHGHSSLGSTGWDSAPTGYTRGATSGSGFSSGTALNYKNITTTDGSVGQTGGQNTSYAAATVEIIN